MREHQILSMEEEKTESALTEDENYRFSSSIALVSPIALFANSCNVFMNPRTSRICSPE